MYDIFGKVAIITGGANGVGKCLVEEFLKEKAKYVAFIDVDAISGREFENEIKLNFGDGRAKFFQCDVSKLKELYDVFDQVLNENGYIDIVVNNAGIAVETLDMFVKEIEVNFTAVVSSTLKALEIMRVDQGGKGGTIINISSITALSKNISHLHIYAATKKATLFFSTRLGETHFPRTKVRVMTTCLGATETQIIHTCVGFDDFTNETIKEDQKLFSQMNLIQSAQDVAKGVVECYKNGKSGSTWIISNKEVRDITEKLDEVEDIVASKILV